MLASKRLHKELKDLQKDPLTFCSAGPVADDILHWQVKMMGPPDSPYVGGVFSVALDFPSAYPFAGPKITFQTKMFHPNIDDSGIICLPVGKWSASTTVSEVLLSLYSLISEPNFDDPVHDIARLYKTDKNEFDTIARSWTQKYALLVSDSSPMG